MDAGTIPCVYAFGAAEGGVADKTVATAIVVSRVKVSAVMVFFCPVEFVVGKRCIVETAKETQDMRVVVKVAEVIAVVFEISCFVPSFGDTGVVLPCVEEIEVVGGCPVYHLQGEVLVYFGDVAGVADALGSGFGATDGVAGVDALGREFHGEVVVLGHDWVVGEWCAEGCVNAVAEDPDGTRTGG
jgi:hypothetical protein